MLALVIIIIIIRYFFFIERKIKHCRIFKDAGAEAFDWSQTRTMSRTIAKLNNEAGLRYKTPLHDWKVSCLNMRANIGVHE